MRNRYDTMNMISVRYKTEATVHGEWRQAFFEDENAADVFAHAYDGPIGFGGEVEVE